MRYKVVLLGESCVGKSCILLRLVDDSFTNQFITTIGIDFRVYQVPSSKPDAEPITLQIWDTAGQERFKTITTAYFRNSHAVVYIFDMNNRQSFDRIQYWLDQVKEHSGKPLICMLLGNKCDDTDTKYPISIEEAAGFAHKHDMRFYPVSAKNACNINEAFSYLAKKLDDIHIEEPETIRLHGKQEKSKCCS